MKGLIGDHKTDEKWDGLVESPPLWAPTCLPLITSTAGTTQGSGTSPFITAHGTADAPLLQTEISIGYCVSYGQTMNSRMPAVVLDREMKVKADTGVNLDFPPTFGLFVQFDFLKASAKHSRTNIGIVI